MLALQQGSPSCGDHSHDDFKAVPQEVRSVLSLLTVLSSLEKGQDQNDEKLREEERRASVGTFILRVATGPSLKENVWVSRGQGGELATCTLELPESSVLY